jgi:hypothetical protein
VWEHYLTSSIAYYYINRTQRGGSVGTHITEASQNDNPIGLWFLRRLFWATDHFTPTKEVRLTMCNEIAHNKKERKLENVVEEGEAVRSNSDKSVFLKKLMKA